MSYAYTSALAQYVCETYSMQDLEEYKKEKNVGSIYCSMNFSNCFEELACYLHHPYDDDEGDELAALTILFVVVIFLFCCIKAAGADTTHRTLL